jgi:YVTN family beta-propeller protein
MRTASRGALMRRFRSVRGVLVLGLAGALVGVAPDGVSAVAARSRCRPTALVTNAVSGTVSMIDAKTRTKHPTDIAVGSFPFGVAVTPDGKTAFVVNGGGPPAGGSVSTIGVKTRTKDPTDIPVGTGLPWGADRAVSPVTGSLTGFCEAWSLTRYHSATERRSPVLGAGPSYRYARVNPVQNNAPERRADRPSGRTYRHS